MQISKIIDKFRNKKTILLILMLLLTLITIRCHESEKLKEAQENLDEIITNFESDPQANFAIITKISIGPSINSPTNITAIGDGSGNVIGFNSQTTVGPGSVQVSNSIASLQTNLNIVSLDLDLWKIKYELTKSNPDKNKIKGILERVWKYSSSVIIKNLIKKLAENLGISIVL